ncbi:MAG: xylulokinase [Chloroflexota bacterium]|nr:xylulokinase [Chloroflexota bacterium]
MSLVLGLDISTTATKAVLVDEAGGVAGIGSATYPVSVPRPRWSEQDPLVWWDAAVAAIAAALGDAGVRGAEVSAIGLAGQMHGAVLLDADDEPVRPAILWNDQRTDVECEEIRRRVGPQRLIDITGNDALTGFTAPKLLWVRANEPEAWSRVAHLLLPKDFVRLRLTGVHAIDKADGAGTLLFDLATRDWSDEVLTSLDLDPGLCPPSFEGPEVTGVLTAAAASATGLPEGTPVVAGGGDQAANAVGVGAISPGVVALSLGTSGVLFAATDRPVVEAGGRVHAFCHAIPHRWHLMSVMLSAAGSLRWYRDAIAPGISFDELVAEAAHVPAGSNGLWFLPYLTGERSPHPDPRARGAFVGLTVQHDRRHMSRAVLEGVAFGLRDGLDLIVGAGVETPSAVRGSGGGLASPLWRQILADVLGVGIFGVGTTEGAAYGAALLAMPASGMAASVPAAVDRSVSVTPLAEPGPDAEAYAERHALYRELYPALAPLYPRM